MSALAELFARRGVKVTGCDAKPIGVDDLRKLGIDIVAGHDTAHVARARALVVTSAMPKNHPELERARALGLPVIRRAEALGEATSGDGRELVGIAGTHGKSTTTVMTAVALIGAGRDPTALVGARVPSWSGNLRAGGDRLYVLEADEYDRSFLAMSPTVAVVTNVEADHLDIYADLADIRRAFVQFIHGARTIVLCGDDHGATTLPTSSSAEVVRYGITSEEARLRALNVRTESTGAAFAVEYDGELLGSVSLRLAGAHNVLNALAAIGSGLALGAPFAGLAYGLGNFTGAKRRFERVGDPRGRARELSRPPARRGVPAASLFAHARFRPRVRLRAVRRRRRVSHRDLRRAREAAPGRHRRHDRQRVRPGTRQVELARRSRGAGRCAGVRSARRRRGDHDGRRRHHQDGAGVARATPARRVSPDDATRARSARTVPRWVIPAAIALAAFGILLSPLW